MLFRSNPYIVNSGYFNESPGNSKLRFTRLPSICTVSIYTISGEFITSFKHDDAFSGNEWWDLKNGQGNEIAPGLYIYILFRLLVVIRRLVSLRWFVRC